MTEPTDDSDVAEPLGVIIVPKDYDTCWIASGESTECKKIQPSKKGLVSRWELLLECRLCRSI